jgi:hypothetical protein
VEVVTKALLVLRTQAVAVAATLAMLAHKDVLVAQALLLFLM